MLSRNCFTTILVIITILFLRTELNAQSRLYEGPTDEAGDHSAMRIGLMNGNRVSLRISNKVSLGGWPSPQVSLWPNDASGLNTFDSFNLIIGNMVFIQKCSTCTIDSVPITNEADIGRLSPMGQLDTLWYTASSGLQEGYIATKAQVQWGFYPVFDYFNPAGEYPAMSNHPESWPPDGWPSRGLEKKWPGEWNGRFGRGVRYADLESYWVCNDAQDQEKLPLNINPKVQFYPRPGVKIGDISPSDISVQMGAPWGGLGLRAEIRAYQWNNMQSRDAVFLEYNITNISDYDITRGVFGFYLDAANGNKAPSQGLEDQVGFFDVLQDFMYTWSVSGTGFGGGKPCVSGWAFLESPGIATDVIDNDDDGMVNERRDNTAEDSWNGLPAQFTGVDVVKAAFIASHDTAKFFTYFNYKRSDQIPCIQQGLWWPADENGDWKNGDDKNGNGVYDVGDNAGDDVGLDGVGPGDINYMGPDADGTECNHKPDYKEGIGAEPNFAITDIAESDMLGLTSFVMFSHPHETSPQIKYHRACYDTLAAQRVKPWIGDPVNLYAAFGSGVFRFAKGRTERLSMANVNSYDDLTGLNDASRNHPAPSLYAKLTVVKAIYASSYRFAQPPAMPRLTALADDGKVYLSWDDRAEKFTREPMLGGANDFEGYKLYKATDKHFKDAEVIRDPFGNPAGKKPIFQCDLADSIVGYPDQAYYNGIGYYVGDDAGIKHSFIDNDVQNGRTYYYGLVAYDYGFKSSGAFGVMVPPTENTVVIDLDENENIRSTGINVQVVTPHQHAAGYTDPQMTFIDPENVLNNGTIKSEIFIPDSIKSNHTYKIKFQIDTIAHAVKDSLTIPHKRDGFLSTVGYSILDATLNNKLLYKETPANHIPQNWNTSTTLYTITVNLKTSKIDTLYYIRPSSNKGLTSEIVDGMRLIISPNSDVPALDGVHSGWLTGNVPIEVQLNPKRAAYFAYDYNIIFIDTTLEPSHKSKIERKTIPYSVTDFKDNYVGLRGLLGGSFPFHVINKSFPDSTASGYKGYELLDMVVDEQRRNGIFDPDTDYVLVSYTIPYLGRIYSAGTIFGIRFPYGMPKPGDVYRVKFNNALKDSIMFTMNVASSLDASRLKEDMKRIKVVPNPYIVTNTMEPYISNTGFNERRILLFTHIPAQSTIKIFTSSGVFIRQIDIENPVDDGTYHWDMLTKEGLEIAAGIYVYQVKSKATGAEQFGKFAVIK